MAAVVLGFASASLTTAGWQRGDSVQCRPTGPLVRLPGLRGASGLTVSGRVPGRLWTHNDSGEPVLFALDPRGSVTGRVRLTGAAVEDWEAIAAGPCGADSCLYMADIGDNGYSPEALEQMLRYPWPGNVRELENVVERACALATGHVIDVDDLPDEVRHHHTLVIASDHVRPLHEIGREYILAALERNRGSKTLTAEQLRIVSRHSAGS
jgi:hypothetical protein